MKKEVRSEKTPKPFGPYSSAVVVGNAMYISGNAGFDINQKLVGENDVKAQTRQALTNIRNLLEDNGFSMDDIVRSTVYLSDIELWNDFNEAYEPFFNKPYPARTCIGCQLNGFLVEIECTAVRRE